MYKKKSDIYNVIVIVCSILLTIIVYNKLPDLVPIHWNTMGKLINILQRPLEHLWHL